MTELTTITARGQKAIDKYFKAIDKARNSAWGVAKVVSETINGETFETDFGSLSTYADAIGLSKASVSLQNRAYKLFTSNEELADFNYTAVCAMLPIDASGVDVVSFVEAYEIDSKTSVSTIKTNVKEYLAGLEDKSKDEPETETEDENEVVSGEVEETETENNNSVVMDTYNVPEGTNFIVIDGSIITLDADDLAAIEGVLNL